MRHFKRIHTGMPAPARQRWGLLFNSDVQGKSFSTMTTRVCGQGATLMLVRDTVSYGQKLPNW